MGKRQTCKGGGRSSDLGPLQSERVAGFGEVGNWIGYSVAFMFLILGILGFCGVIGKNSVNYGTGLCVIAVIIAVVVFCFHIDRLRIHRHGICRQTTFRTIELDFDDIATIRWKETQVFLNGAFQGTAISIHIQAREGLDTPDIRFDLGGLKKPDEDLLQLRDRISTLLMRRMRTNLDRKDSLKWTEQIRFHANELEISASKKRESAFYSYRELVEYEFENGQLLIFVAREKKPIVREATDGPNFYPGLLLLEELKGRRKRSNVENKRTDDR
jgi:hypothetical protein